MQEIPARGSLVLISLAGDDKHGYTIADDI